MPRLQFPIPGKRHYPAIPLEQCLAKTKQKGEDRTPSPGATVSAHLKAAFLVIKALRKIWDGYPLAKRIPLYAERLALFHDIGKVTPAFQRKLYQAIGWPNEWGSLNENEGGHARNSALFLKKEFVEECSEDFAFMAGCHHGGAWKWRKGGEGTLEQEELGGQEWKELRFQLMQELKLFAGLQGDSTHMTAKGYDPIAVGAVVLADWISSGMELDFSQSPSQKTCMEALEATGFTPKEWKAGLNFQSLFSFPPNPMQKACEGLATPGGIIIVESGMGTGKTEAALYLAYQLLEKKKANGIYFAMPSRLTSEKIHERLAEFLKGGFNKAECEDATPMLIHGNAWLKWTLVKPDEFEEQSNDSTGNPLKDSWFQTKKRALLAPYGAGTIDQALLSILNVRHRDLRALALTGKVVIFDEVHSYDAYTGSLLVSLVQHLQTWGASVIILSATLTQEARNRLLDITEEAGSKRHSYPLISCKAGGQAAVKYCEFAPPPPVSVSLQSCTSMGEAAQVAIQHAMNKEQVLWIVNTVRQAQELYRQLQAGCPPCLELGLIHSCFPVGIRQKQEAEWVDLLGKYAGAKRQEKGRILIATQVLEQSVDVDADFLITQLAPTDMLFQRIGRLWRHTRLDTLRPPGAKRQALITFPEDWEAPETWSLHEENARPYAPYVLWRTAQIWGQRGSVTLPEDIRPLLQETYEMRGETTREGNKMKQNLQKEREDLERLAELSQGEIGNPYDEDSPTLRTRYDGESQCVQVLLLKKDCLSPRGDWLKTFFDETPIRLPSPQATHKEKNIATAALMRNLITVPEYKAPDYEDFRLDFLAHLLWTGKNEIRPLRAAFVDDDGTLLTQSCLPVQRQQNNTLRYHEKLGYYVQTNK